MNDNSPVSIEEAGGIVGWIAAALGSAVAALFYRLNKTNEERLSEHKEQISKLHETCEKQQAAIDECTEDRQQLRVDVVSLQKDLEHVKQRLA